MNREFIDRSLQQVVARSGKQKRLWRVVLNGEFMLPLIVVDTERYSHCDFQSLARGQERVAQNAVNPRPEVSAELKGGESFQCLNVGFLNQVFGFLAILREPVSEVVKLIEEREGQSFEGVELEIRV